VRAVVAAIGLLGGIAVLAALTLPGLFWLVPIGLLLLVLAAAMVALGGLVFRS
jgi:hypothetical protein